jgi:hypothetical protein
VNFLFQSDLKYAKEVLILQILQELRLTEHKHGEMDVTEHQKVYSGFIKFGLYVGIFSIFLLIFLALFNS